MLSVFDQGVCARPPAAFNLAVHVLAAGLANPDKIALAVLGLSGAQRWSYARLTQAVLGTGTGLQRAGIGPGDIVLMRLGNTVDFPVAYLGALAIGAVPVPTSSQLTETETGVLLGDLAPKLVLHDPAVACPATRVPTVDVETLRSWRDLPMAAPQMGSPNRLGYIVYTSGTSGKPRAVEHAHRAIWARGMMMQGWYGLTAEDRLLHAGAFNWTYTLGTGLMDPWTVGATALIPDAKVTHAQVPLLLKRHEATIFAAAPGVYRNILKSDTGALPHLRHGLSAGEKLPDQIREHWRAQTGTEIFEAYGMSECSTFISSAPGAPAPAGTLGRPQPGRRVAILGPDGPVPINTPGTIAVHRSDPGLMLGYRNAPSETAQRFQGDWFLTGDQGQMDDTGAITYLGRDDDMMNAGGYRVSPLEVEAALIAAPGVTDIAVTEVQIKPEVRVITAFYTAEQPLDDTTLQAFAAGCLARYKQPRLWVHMSSLPRNPNGKLSRKTLRDSYERKG